MTRPTLGHPSFPGVMQREHPSSWESGGRWELEGGLGLGIEDLVPNLWLRDLKHATSLKRRNHKC